MYNPKITLVTPSFNQGDFIEDTIQSIISQEYNNLEYFIIDGASTDQTIDIIRKYENHITYWCSESDKGQSDAIMKGLNMAKGEIFQWVNSDDILAPGALKSIARNYKPSYDVYAGRVLNFGNEISDWVTPNQNLTPGNLLRWKNKIRFHQPGVWLKTSNLRSIGGINTQLNYSFDLDLLIRYLLAYPKVVYLNEVLVKFRHHQDSKTVSSQQNFSDEAVKILQDYQNSQDKGLKKIAAQRLKDIQWEDQKQCILNSDLGKMAKLRNAFMKVILNPSQKLNKGTVLFLRDLLRS